MLDPTSATSLIGILQWVNSTSGGILGFMVVCVVFLLSFFILIGRYGTAESLLATSFVTFLVAAVCFAMEIFPISGLVTVILIGVIAYFMQ